MVEHGFLVSAKSTRVAGFLFATLLSIVLVTEAAPRTSTADAPASKPEAPERSFVNTRLFEEPLVATRISSPAEDKELSLAIAEYQKREAPDDFSELESYLSRSPQSPWRVALLTDLGLAYYHYGYFSRAISSWENAWKEGRTATSGPAKLLVDRAVGELARMHARLGHADRLEALFKELGDRPISGPATEAITGAREGLWMMRNNPGVAYLCGPLSLRNLLLSRKASPEQVRLVGEYRSGAEGVTLAELAGLAERVKLPFKLAYREKDQPFPMPAIVHWKVSHFAALLGETNGRFHIQDPTFGTDLWVSREALESESSGYFLVPSEKLVTGLREVGLEEAGKVRGMGFTATIDPSGTTPTNTTAIDQGPTCGMCGYNVIEAAVSLNLKDTPVGYTPPIGPPVNVTITYNQREAGQPANFSFFNVSPKWTLNWLTYIQDDPTLAGANVMRYVAGGGYVIYFYYDSTTGYFGQEITSNTDAYPSLTSSNPITYRRLLTDGSIEVYSHSDGAATYPRRVFLTQIIDPAGNAVTLNYDDQFRLTSVTDATGRNTTFSYDLPNFPLLVTKVTDPFGRYARFAYDAGGRLSQITDVVGLTSSFTYDSSNLVNSMSTPYGTTSFAYGGASGSPPPISSGPSRFVEITDPLGNSERVEYLQGAPGIPSEDSPVPTGITPFNFNGSMFMNGRNTFYWDKHVLAIARGDYTKARIRHWLHDTANDPTGTTSSSVIESVKYPLERRIWRNYPGQYGCGGCTGSLDKPSIVARVLGDGTTQSTQFTYHPISANVTSITDPVGRVTLYDYNGPYGLDLLDIKQQTSPGVFSTIASFTYNNQHLPLTSTDAAGQPTTYTYNSAGQLTQVTDPLNNTTKYVYDGLGYLTQIINPNNRTAASFTYDEFRRVATRTDSEGYTLKFAYDAMDRITKTTYPDGTTREYTWNKLDLASVKDRQGRMTQYSYDAVRNLVDITDPLGRHTKLGYYENGRLKSLTDPNGNTTAWSIDIENRVTAKQYADGRQVTNTYGPAAGRLAFITDPLGQVKQFTYAEDDLLTGISYLNAVNPTPNVTFAYDPYFRRLVSMTDGSGTTQYQYQPLGVLGTLKLQSEVGPFQNSSIAYEYDALGRIIGRTVDASTESFGYDSLGRLSSHVGPLGEFDLNYLGQTTQLTSRRLQREAAGTQWIYDSNKNDRRLKEINNAGAIRDFYFSTTPESLITQIAETGGYADQVWNFAYDDSNRLLSGSSSRGANYAYGYDAADNILSVESPTGTKSGSYNTVNQITSFGDRAFVYDANGNLIDDGNRTYKWDAENQLLSVADKEEPTTTTFRYDGLGRRIALVASDEEGSRETHYLWCGDSLCQARNSNDAVTRRYYPEGELVFSTPVYYALDQLGSVRSILTNPSGGPAVSFDYDPYGRPIPNPGTNETEGQVSTDFRYAGLFYERNSGLYLAEHRAYDARTGRWLSRDPIAEAGGVNVYGYVRGNPITYTDLLGLECPTTPTPPAQQVPNAPSPSDQQLVAIDTLLAEIQAAAQAAGNSVSGLIKTTIGPAAQSVSGFITTTIEPSLSGALTDFGSVFLNLEKGLLDPGVASGVVAIVQTVQNPNVPANQERGQLCALFPEDCPPPPKH
jgi:RHS repeat-associated protein